MPLLVCPSWCRRFRQPSHHPLCSGIQAQKTEGHTLFFIYSQISINFYLDLSSNLRAVRRLRNACQRDAYPFFCYSSTEIDNLFECIDFCNFPDSCHFRRALPGYVTVVLLTLLRRFSAIPRFTSRASVKSTCGSTPVLVSSSLFPTFSLARSINDASTLMSLMSVVPQSKPPSSAPTRRHSKKTQDLLLDFAPLSLSIGIETAGLGGVMRNTTIPIKNHLL